jgi:hypothetical protein
MLFDGIYSPATDSWNISIHESFPYDITNIRKVNPKDLALYVDWSWKSPEFEKLLNGTSRIRLKNLKGG